MEICEVGGCGKPGQFPFGKWTVCRKHLDAHITKQMDLDVYFEIKERKLLEDNILVERSEQTQRDLDDVLTLFF